MKKIISTCGIVLTLSLSIFGHASANDEGIDEEKNQIKELIKDLSDDDKIDIIVSAGEPLELFNYETKSRDSLTHPHKLTLEEGAAYVPPFKEIQALYRAMIREGASPFAALYEANVVTLDILSQDQN